MPLLFHGDETIEVEGDIDVIPAPEQSPLRIPEYMTEYEEEIDAENYVVVNEGDAYEFRRPYVLVIRRQVEGQQVWFSEVQADVGESRRDEAEPARSRDAAIERATRLSKRLNVPLLGSIIEPSVDDTPSEEA